MSLLQLLYLFCYCKQISESAILCYFFTTILFIFCLYYILPVIIALLPVYFCVVTKDIVHYRGSISLWYLHLLFCSAIYLTVYTAFHLFVCTSVLFIPSQCLFWFCYFCSYHSQCHAYDEQVLTADIIGAVYVKGVCSYCRKGKLQHYKTIMICP